MSGIQHMLLGPTVVSGGVVVDVTVNVDAVSASASVGAATVSIVTPFAISSAAYSAQSDAWNVATGFLTSYNKNISTQEIVPQGLFLSPDGTNMYVVGSAGDDVNQYTLTTPWLVNTATYVRIFSVATEDTFPVDIFFSDDGTRMYVLGGTGDDVNQYSLSTAWDISTASYVQNFSVATETTQPNGLDFSPDGTRMYVSSQSPAEINQYSLSTAWDISTASYVQVADVSAVANSPFALRFKSDGTIVLVLDANADNVNGFSLSTAWDISTLSFFGADYVGSQDTTPSGLSVKPDGSAYYMVGYANDIVHQFAMGGYSFISQENGARGCFFKPDGTKMYICGSSGDDVNEYNLSTAWDVTTATYVQNFSVAAQETLPNDLYFSDDGTRMYIVGGQVDEVNQYSLSTAWDISTASFVRLKSVAAEETLPNGIFFSPDGSYMFIAGDTGNDVTRYSLSSAWDISTATADQTFSVSSQTPTPNSLSFSSDGTKMFVLGGTTTVANATVWRYNLSTAWDLTTASYVESGPANFASSSTQYGLYMKPDGSGYFICNLTIIYAYEIAAS